MLYKAALTLPEMAAVLCVFKLLDRDGDGYLKLEDLQKAQGIEKKVVDGVLEVGVGVPCGWVGGGEGEKTGGVKKRVWGGSPPASEYHPHLCFLWHRTRMRTMTGCCHLRTS